MEQGLKRNRECFSYLTDGNIFGIARRKSMNAYTMNEFSLKLY